MSTTTDERIEESGSSRRLMVLLCLGLGGITGILLVLLSGKLSPVLSIGALGGLFLFVLIVRQPTLGLLLTAAVVPIERLGRLTDDSTMYTISLMRIAGLLALGGLLLHAMLTKRRFVFGVAFTLYAVFVGFSVVSVTYTGHLKASVQMAGTFLGNLLFLFLILNLTQDKKLADRAIAIWLLVSVLTGFYAMYDWHFGSGQTGGISSSEDLSQGRTTDDRASSVFEDRGESESLSSSMSLRRSMGPTSHATVYGINLILTLPFFLYFLRKRIGWIARVALYGGLLVVLYNILLTNTRAAILLAVLVLVLSLLRKLWPLDRTRLTAGAVFLAIAAFFVPADIYNRALDVSNYTPERSATMRIRFTYWQAALELISENWLTGVGTGNEKALSSFVRTDATEQVNAHNDYLQTMMEVGIPQACVFFAFLALLLRYSFKAAAVFRPRADAQDEYWFLVACQIAMIATLLYGLQVGVFHFPIKGWWLVAGLVCVYYRYSQNIAARQLSA